MTPEIDLRITFINDLFDHLQVKNKFSLKLFLVSAKILALPPKSTFYIYMMVYIDTNKLKSLQSPSTSC